MWQWGWFNTIGGQVIQHSTLFGKMWYVVVFVFRLIVVLGLGSSVYGDEQSNFKCSAIGAGCDNACYNQFTRISHLRFWGFQLLFLFTPVIIFHFLALYLTGQLEKIEAEEKKTKADYNNEQHQRYEERKTQNRKLMVGKPKKKSVFVDGKLKTILANRTIEVAYFISVVARLVVEGLFLYFTYVEYNYPDHLCNALKSLLTNFASTGLECNDRESSLQFLWTTFPEIYPCSIVDGSGVVLACAQNVAFRNSVVPCWTSRAYEKTIFLRYMNVLSAISFVLCALEILWIPFKKIFHASNKGGNSVKSHHTETELRTRYREEQLFHQPREIYNTQASRRGSGRHFGEYKEQLLDLPPPPQSNETSAKRSIGQSAPRNGNPRGPY